MTHVATHNGIHIYRAGLVFIAVDDERRFHSVYLFSGGGFVKGEEHKRRAR